MNADDASLACLSKQISKILDEAATATILLSPLRRLQQKTIQGRNVK